MSAWAQYVLSGLSSGCVFALVALGFVLIARVTSVYNFAQGQYVMLGGMLMWACKQASMPLALAIVVTVLAVAAVAVVQERTTVAWVRSKMPVFGLAVTSLGVGVLLEGVALVIWGKNLRSITSFYPGTFHLLGASLDKQTLWIWGATFVALLFMVALFQYTSVGKAMRASAMNPIAARLVGIRAGRMSMLAFALGGGLGGLVGGIALPLTGVSWESGVAVGLVGFIAAAVADFDKPGRAVAAGLTLGVVEDVAAGKISSTYRQLFVYGVLLVYLIGKDLVSENGLINRARKSRVSRRTRAGLAQRVAGQREGLSLSDRIAPGVARANARWTLAIPVVLVGLMILLPLMFTSGSEAMSSLMVIVLSAIAGTGLVLVMGLGRMFNLGQSGFVLIGGYTVAILTVNHGWNPWAAIAAGTVLATIASLAVGWLTLRLQGFNLAIATLGISLALVVFMTEATSFSGGVRGIVGLPPLTLGGLSSASERDLYYLCFIVLCVCLVVARNLSKSRLGRALRAVGADEDGAQALGVNAFRLKLVVFTIGGAMAGVAGGLWVYYLQLAAPENWAFALTISLVTYVVVGGLTSVYGGLVGALVVGAIQYVVTKQTAGFGESSSEYEVVLNGAFLIFFLLIFRQGIAVALSVDSVRNYGARLRGIRGGGLPDSLEEAPQASSGENAESAAAGAAR